MAGGEEEAGLTVDASSGVEEGAVKEGSGGKTHVVLKSESGLTRGAVVDVGGVNGAEGDVLGNTPAVAQVKRGETSLTID